MQFCNPNIKRLATGAESMLQRLQILIRRLVRLFWSVLAWHGRLVLRLLAVGVAALLLIAAAWQFWFLPRLDSYRERASQEISKAAGVPVLVGGISGGWDGFRPSLTLHRVEVRDARQQTALRFETLRGALTWWSLPLGKLHFSNIALDAPELMVQHEADGGWSVAGIKIRQGKTSDSGFANWLLAQGGLDVRRGRIVLRDAQAMSRTFSDFKFSSSNLLGFRRFSFSLLPQGLSGIVSGEGKLFGRRIDAMQEWSGSVRLTLPELNAAALGSLAQSVSSHTLPKLQGGQGGLQGTLSFADGRIDKVDADLKIENLLLSHLERELALPVLDASLHWRSNAKRDQLNVDLHHLQGAAGEVARNVDLAYERNASGHSLKINQLNLAGLSSYLVWLPQPERWVDAQLQGQLASLSLQWQGPFTAPRDYRGRIALRDAGLELPVSTLSLVRFDADADFDTKGGSLKLASSGFDLIWPSQLPEALRFQKLAAGLRWHKQNADWLIRAEEVDVVNAETRLQFKGQYLQPADGTLGSVDFTGGVSQLPAARVYAYLPRVVGDDTIAWLKRGLVAGMAQNARFELKGALAGFPWAQGDGRFLVDLQARGVTLNYGDDWPALTDVSGPLRFEGLKMVIPGAKARWGEVILDKVDVQIPDLENDLRVLVNGQGHGPTAAFLRFVKESPVQAATEGALDTLKAEGRGQLGLKLAIPIDNPDRSTVSGFYRLEQNRLDFGGGIPLLTQASGRVEFSDTALKIPEIRAQALGGETKVSGGTDAKGRLQLQLAGRAQIGELAKQYTIPLAERMQGPIEFLGQLQVAGNDYEINLNSNLQSLQVDLPAPLGKPAGRALPFKLKLAGNAGLDRIEFAHDGLVQGALVQKVGGALTGGIALGHSAPVNNPRGLTVSGGWNEFDVPAWLALLDGDGTQAKPSPVTELKLSFNRVLVAGKTVNRARLRGKLLADGRWNFGLDSTEVTGQILWRDGARPLVTARLARLALPLPEGRNGEDMALPAKLPGIDLQVDDLRYQGKSMGQLTADAVQTAQGWTINQLQLSNADGEVRLNAQWDEKSNTSAGKFRIRTESMGKLLTRFGYPDAMKKAPVTLEGEGSWQGYPFAPQLATLEGKIKLDVAQGSFVKIEPGAGRFLSILSLQALPRRITLDFSDVFSEGFEFDSIKGEALVNRGIARTENLALDGQAAKVKFTGTANFVAGTQNLRVRIAPVLGDSVALATAVVNPVVGAATYVVQKALKDPLGRLVAYEYEITGTMTDPKIRKLGWFSNE